MKRSGELKRTTPLARGASTLKQKTPMSRGQGFVVRARPIDASDPSPAPKRKRSRGLKGRPPTAAEKAFMDLAGKIPCLACMIDGRENHHISLHHIDGRTKPGAHFLVLPLCAPHHQQDDTDPQRRVSLHGRKETFTARYGTEAELLQALKNLIGGMYSTE